MPWKTIGYIAAALLIILFIAFNLHNTSDVSFVFFSIKDVPVFFTVFISMIMGCLIMLPFTLSMHRQKSKPKKEEDLSIEQLLQSDDAKAEKSPKKKKRRKKKDPYGESESIDDLDIR